MQINTETYWRDGYMKLHKEYDFFLRENKQLKEQIDLLVQQKMVMQYEIDLLNRILSDIQGKTNDGQS